MVPQTQGTTIIMVKSPSQCQLDLLMQYNLLMVSQLIIHPEATVRQSKIAELLSNIKLSKSHPDVLWLDENTKLGVDIAKQIQQFLSLKPYQGESQAVVIIAAENFTLDAQNALLKTLEEPPHHTTILLGVGTEDQLIPTIISRCQSLNLKDTQAETPEVKFQAEIETLIDLPIEKRFQFIEKLEAREEFLEALTFYFRKLLLNKPTDTDFLEDLIEAQKWNSANVNIRAILEYLMLKMPQVKQ